MAGKSLQEVWMKMNEESKQKKEEAQKEIQKINEDSELRRKEWLDRMKVYEQFSVNTIPTSAAAAGGTPVSEWIVFNNTAWIYPQIDLDNTVNNIQTNNLLGPTITWGQTYSIINFTKVDNFNYVFPTIEDVINFYSEMFFQSTLSQPISNLGYSLGVGTILRSKRRSKLNFKLESGLTIVEMTLMSQITSQSVLPSGGDSPDGTVGWGSIYLDWNADSVADNPNDPTPNQYVDPLRFKLNI
jgi:hypothetical protein